MTDQMPLLNAQRFFKRLELFYANWAHKIPEVDAMCFLTGRSNLTHMIPHTIGLHHWLMGYHLTDTFLLFTRTTLTIITSQKKYHFLEELKKTKSKIEIRIFVKQKEAEASLAQLEQTVEKGFKNVAKIGQQVKETQILRGLSEEYVGKAMKKIEKIYELKAIKIVSVPYFLEECRAIHDSQEQKNLEIAGALSTLYLKKTVEKLLERSTSSILAQICHKLEFWTHGDKLLWRSLLKRYPQVVKVQCQLSIFIQQAKLGGKAIEICTPALTQIEDNSRLVSRGVVYLTCVSQYLEYKVQTVRTIFMDVKNETFHQANYAKLEKIHAFILSRIRAGVRLGDVYDDSMRYIEKKCPGFADCFGRCFGWGTGAFLMMKSREIVEGSKHIVREGESYAIRTNAYDVDGMTLIIGDTVLVETGGAKVLTKGFGSGFEEIDLHRTKYEQEVKEQVEVEVKLDSGDQEVVEDAGGQSYREEERKIQLRNRRTVNTEGGDREQKQRRLQKQKLEELMDRLQNKPLDSKEKHQVIRCLSKLRAYKEKREYEGLKLKRGQLQIDTARDILILPFGDKLVPVHIGMIRNVSKNEEGMKIVLRINFFTQETAGLQSGINVVCPSIPQLWYGHEREPGEAGEDQTPVFIKELICQSHDKDRFGNLFKALKDSIKRIRTLEQEQRDRVDLVAQPMLQLGRRAKLSNVTLRPSPTNRKIVGNLELHNNGYRFISNSEKSPFHLDVTTNNIKHAFYQPATNDVLIVTIHLHLRSPLFVANKKKTVDVQFYREVTVQFEEVGGVYKRRGLRIGRTDQDEVELERQEREYRKKLNAEFREYCRLAQEAHSMKFEKPERSLGFYGVPDRANMLVMPTASCLVAFSEMPFFVVSLEDIDLLHFERVNYTSKSFDLTLVFKDLTTWRRISNVPVDSLEMLKDWITSKDMIFTESTMNMNWTNTLAEIRHNPEDFIKEGGWQFLTDPIEEQNSEEEKVEEKGDSDSSFKEDEWEEESSESDSSYSESSSSEYEEVPSEEEEGESWEELERKAIEEERRDRLAGPVKRKLGRH